MNPDAPLIQAMAKKYDAEPGSPMLVDYAAMLYDQAPKPFMGVRFPPSLPTDAQRMR